MPLDQAHVPRGQAGAVPASLQGESLPYWVGRGDALAPAVTGATDAPHYGIDAVAVALGVGQPFEQEEGGALAHDKAVRAVGIGPGASGRQRAYLAKFNIGGHPHIAVDATHQGGIVFVLDQSLISRIDGCQGRGTGGVTDEIWPFEIEQIGNPTRHTIRQLTGHGIFSRQRQPAGHALIHLLFNPALHLAG